MKVELILGAVLGFAVWQGGKPTPEELYIHYKADHEINGNYLRAYESALAEHRRFMRSIRM